MTVFGSAQLGSFVFGEVQFNGPTSYEIIPPTPADFDSLRRSQLGWGQITSRAWTRSYDFEREPSRDTGKFANITITSISGALIGNIRTDIQKSILQSLEFTDDENGSADFTMRLTKLPRFEILPFSMISVNVGESSFDWYKGVLTYPDDQGTDRDFFEFKGFGLRRFLETLQADVDFAGGLDLTTIVTTIIEVHIAPFSPITFNPAKIGLATGVITGSTIQLGKYSIRHVLDLLASMALTSTHYYQWGVDGDGDFYWERIALDDLERTFFIGYELNDFKPKINFEDVRNAITLQRQEGRGSGGVGWAIAGLFNNESSIAKYGRNELVKQIPGFIGTADANTYGNALLQELAEPVSSSRTDKWQAFSELDFLRHGNYRFILPLGDFQETINDIDDESEFAIIGGGDMTKANDDTFFVFADGSVRLTFTDSAGVRAELDIEAMGLIQEIRFYLRSSKAGGFLTVGVGSSVWDQATTVLDIPIAETFIPIIWDVSSLDIRTLGKFAIRVDEDLGVPTNVWIDKLDILFAGHKTYTMKLKRSTYRYAPDASGVRSEYGTLPDSLPKYIAGLQAAAEELKFTGEIR